MKRAVLKSLTDKCAWCRNVGTKYVIEFVFTKDYFCSEYCMDKYCEQLKVKTM